MNTHLGTRVDLPKVTVDPGLDQFADAPLREAVVGLKAYRKDRFGEVAQLVADEINEITGLDITMQLTAITDAVVLTLWRRFLKELPDTLRGQVGLFALGGYGRGELNPASDLDLVAIVDGKVPDAIMSMWKRFETSLWDAGFQVGASCRAMAELAGIIKEDFVTATAVLECRALEARPELTDSVYGMIDRWRNRTGRQFLAYKFKEMDERWAKAGVSIYMNEPEVKTHPGCLRDIQLLRNAAFAALGSRNLHALRELGTFAYPDIDNLFAANDHLLKIRSLLHFEHQRRQDVWLLADQLLVAELMGYESANRLSAVEHLLRDHYAMTRGVVEAVQLARQRLRALGHLGRRFVLIKTRSRLNEDCVIIDRQVYVQHRDFWQQPNVLVRIMRAFRRAQERRLRISLEFQKAIQQNLSTLRTPDLDDEAIQLFFQVLGDRGNVAMAVRDLHSSGLLTVFIPEWQGLVCLKQWGTYHQYTVDEHTLATLDHYDSVMNRKASGLPMMQEILSANPRPDLFALALILHDLGKFMGNGHVERGALMVGDIATRLKMQPADEEFVHFLVLEHVTLSDASRMRDITDLQLLGDIASRMGSVSRLAMLYALTWCDARAVGEDVLTGWQESLLFELYRSVHELLTDRPEPVPHRQELENVLVQDGADPQAVKAWLDALPREYSRQVAIEDASWHFYAIQALSDEQPVQIRVYHGEGGLQVDMAINRRGFLPESAAAFAAASLSVEAARIWRPRGEKVTYLHFLLNDDTKSKDEEACQALARSLERLAKGELTASDLIRQTTCRLRVRLPDTGDMPPEVMINLTGDRWIIDVRCKDRPGLLNGLTRTLEKSGLDCTFASVATYGDVARDVFYAVAQDGAQVDKATVIEALTKAA